ncbi:MAG: c-type cytochrome domain-containing protein [Pirellulales bacterium]
MRSFRANHRKRCRRLAARLAAIVCAAASAAAQGQEHEPAEEPSPAAAQSGPADAEPARSDDHPPAESKDKPVDFFADVRPILVERCWKCHGPQKRSGGLRLDAREFARRGGDSGRHVLGGTPATNELLARVSSSDRAYRMPKNAPPLSKPEIELLGRWVGEGTPWPVPSSASKPAPFYKRAVYYLVNLADRYQAEYAYAMPYTIGFLALNVALLAVIRCRTAFRNGRGWTAGRLARFCRFCDGVNSREVLLLLAVSVVGVALAVARGHVLKIESELAKANRSHHEVRSPWSNTPYGWPPKPIRPDHPKQVAGTYYRGNCERNPELFNEGNYLTATFHVSLCDKEHRQLDVGQALPADGIFARVEIKRAPGTTELLFSNDLMASVLMVKNFYEQPISRLAEEPTRLETLEPQWRWVAYVPIGMPDGRATLAGLIYIYTGNVHDNTLSGTLQYGIQYDLRFADGKLSADSDLWMDSFGNGAFAEPDPPDRLPYREWFDYRPMPVITGTNSKDPKLLGVDQYIKEGLIKPQQEKSNEPSGEPKRSNQTGEPPGEE